MSKNWADFEDDEDSPFIAPMKAPLLPATIEPLEAIPAPEVKAEPIVFISNLKFNVIEDDIEDIIKDELGFWPKDVLMSFAAGKNNGYAVVETDTVEQAQKIFVSLDGVKLQGRPLFVSKESKTAHKVIIEDIQKLRKKKAAEEKQKKKDAGEEVSESEPSVSSSDSEDSDDGWAMVGGPAGPKDKKAPAAAPAKDFKKGGFGGRYNDDKKDRFGGDKKKDGFFGKYESGGKYGSSDKKPAASSGAGKRW